MPNGSYREILIELVSGQKALPELSLMQHHEHVIWLKVTNWLP